MPAWLPTEGRLMPTRLPRCLCWPAENASQPGALGQLDTTQDQGRAPLGTASLCNLLPTPSTMVPSVHPSPTQAGLA